MYYIVLSQTYNTVGGHVWKVELTIINLNCKSVVLFLELGILSERLLVRIHDNKSE